MLDQRRGRRARMRARQRGALAYQININQPSYTCRRADLTAFA